MLIFVATLCTQITTARSETACQTFFFEFSCVFTKAEIFYLYILHSMLAVDIIALVLQSVKRKQVCKLVFHIKTLAFNYLCSSSSIDFQTSLQTQLLVMGLAGHFDSNLTRIDPF